MRQKAMFARLRVSNTETGALRAPASVIVSGDGAGSHAAIVLLTEPEVADRLRVSLACLRRWRLERRGPRFLKVGSLVRYPADELNSWLASLPTGGSAQGPVAAAPRQARDVANA